MNSVVNLIIVNMLINLVVNKILSMVGSCGTIHFATFLIYDIMYHTSNMKSSIYIYIQYTDSVNCT